MSKAIDHCPSCGEYLHDEMGHVCPQRGRAITEEIKYFWDSGIKYVQMPVEVFEEIIKHTIDMAVEEMAWKRNEN